MLSKVNVVCPKTQARRFTDTPVGTWYRVVAGDRIFCKVGTASHLDPLTGRVETEHGDYVIPVNITITNNGDV